MAFISNGFARAEVPDRQVFRRLADRALEQLQHFEPRDTALLLNAYAKLEFRDMALFEKFAKQLRGHPPDGFGEQQLALVANAYARLAIVDKPLFQRLSGWIVSESAGFSPQGIATVLNAFAKVLIRDLELFNTMAAKAQLQLSELSPQHVANILNAHARLELNESEALEPLAGRVAGLVHDFGPVEVSAVTHALIKLGISQRQALNALATTIRERRGEFRARQIATVLHAFSTLTVAYGSLFEDLAPSVLENVGMADDQSVVNLFCAYGRAAQPHGRVIQVLLDRLEPQATALEVRGLVQVFYACGRLALQDAPQVQRFAAALLPHTSLLSPQHVANCLFALARLGAPSGHTAALLAALQSRLLPGSALRFEAQQLANTLHALAALHGEAVAPLPGAVVAALATQAMGLDWAQHLNLFASVVVSCAQLRHRSVPLFARVAKELSSAECELSLEALAELLTAFAVMELFDAELFSWALRRLCDWKAGAPLPVLFQAVAALDFSCHSGAGAPGALFPESAPNFQEQAVSFYRATGLALLAASPKLPAEAVMQAVVPFARANLLAEVPFDLLAPDSLAQALEAAAAEPPSAPTFRGAAAPSGSVGKFLDVTSRDAGGTALDFLLGELRRGVEDQERLLAHRLARYSALLYRGDDKSRQGVRSEVLDDIIGTLVEQLRARAVSLPFADLASALTTLADAGVRPRMAVEALTAAAEARFPPPLQAGDRDNPRRAEEVAALCRGTSALGVVPGPGLTVRLTEFAESLPAAVAESPAPLPLGRHPLQVLACVLRTLNAGGALAQPLLCGMLSAAQGLLEEGGANDTFNELADFLVALLSLVPPHADADSPRDGRSTEQVLGQVISHAARRTVQALRDVTLGSAPTPHSSSGAGQLLALVQAIGQARASALGDDRLHVVVALADCCLRNKQALGASGLSSCFHSFAQMQLLQRLDEPVPAEAELAGERLPRLLATLLRSTLSWAHRLSLAEAARVAHACALALDAAALAESERGEARTGLARLLERLCRERWRWSPREERLVASVGTLLRSEFPELLRGSWLPRSVLAELEQLRSAGPAPERGGMEL